jgi:hypothetical protein
MRGAHARGTAAPWLEIKWLARFVPAGNGLGRLN